ncbi:MAG: AsmA family protein [Alphaproteobacteria bacterium]
MNSFLISVGVVIVLALSAALIGPAFVDWNGYRATIQDAGTRLTGRQVVISGALDVKILPAPVLRAKNVILFSPKDGRQDPLATAREVVLKLDLGALLLGRAEITDLEINDARLKVKVRQDGTVNWVRAAATGAANTGNTDDTTLRRVVLRGASLEFTDEAAETQRWLEGIDAEITAATLSGPFRLGGSFGKTADRRKFVFNTGALRPGGPLRVSGRVDAPFGAQVSFDGALTGWDAPPRFAGRLKLVKSLGPVAKAAKAASGEPGRVVVEAQIDAGLRDVEMTDLSLVVTASGQTLNLAGSGRLGWHGDPDFNIELKALRLDADAILAGIDPAQSMAQSLGAFAGLIDGWLEQTGASGQVALKASSVLLAGELVQDLNLAVDVTAGKMGIKTLKARFPGQADMSISGAMLRGDAVPGFSGKMFINALDIGHFVKWAVPQRYGQFIAVLPKSRGKLSLRAGLEVQDGRFTLSSIDALLDGQAVSGKVLVVREGLGELRADLSFDTLDLDRVFGTEKSRRPSAAAPAISEPGRASPVFNLTLAAKRALWRGREARTVKLKATLSQERWDVSAFAVENFAGAQMSGRGSFGVDLLRPEAKIGTKAQGAVSLKTADLPALIKALPRAAPVLDWLGADRTRELRDAQIDLEFKTTKTAKGWQFDGSAAGMVGGTTIVLKGTGEEGGEAFSLGKATLTLANPQAGKLLSQLGFPAGAKPDGAGATATVSVEPGTGGGIEISASGEALQTQITIVAALEPAPLAYRGKLKIRALTSAGLAQFFTLSALASALPVALDADFAGDGSGLSLSDISGKAGGVRLVAGGEILFDPRPRVALSVALDQVSLPWLAGSVFLAPVASPKSNTQGATWSTDLINTEILDIADIDIKAAIGRLGLGGGFALYDVGTALKFAAGDLSVSGLKGRLGPHETAGRVSADFAVGVRDFTLGLDGEIALANADLGRLLFDVNRRALLNGRVNAKAKFTAQGRSLLSLVSSLAGAGKVSVAKVAVPRLDWAELRQTSAQVANASGPNDAGLVTSLLAKAMRGQTRITLEPGTIEATNGRIKFGPLVAVAGASRGEMTSFVDLPARRFDQELVLSAPASPRLAVIHAGQLSQIAREIVVTNLADSAIRMIEPPAATPLKNPFAKGVLPARPGLVKIRTKSTPPPKASPPAITASPALPGRAGTEVKKDPAPVEKRQQLPTGLIEQRLIDLPLPEISGAAPTAPPMPAIPVVPPA